MRVAVVGATGLVGSKMMEILQERDFPITEFLPVASERSVGSKVRFGNHDYTVIGVKEALAAAPDIALFSAGGTISLEWAEKFASSGTFVIDNSSAWRMDLNIPLIVPEINAGILNRNNRLIANPNCSTIQLVMVLKPLQEEYGLERIVISTYQAITGTGMKAVNQMEGEMAGTDHEMAYPYQILENCIPHCDVFLENDYTREEMKLVHETRKILEDKSLRVTATAVRVPVKGGHCEAVNVELKKSFEIRDIATLINQMPGVVVQDNPLTNNYPMPLFAGNKNDVFVGRIRRDESHPNALNLWVVSDNLRKGAATNAVQIAEYLLKKEWVG